MKTNPWFTVDLRDYEGHMALPEVGQAALLSSEFRRAIEISKPLSVGLVGCAGGNGLGDVIGSDINRVVCVDINSAYLDKLWERYSSKINGLEIICTKVEDLLLMRPLDLIFGGLVFEYTMIDEALKSLSLAIRAGGRLHVLVQMKGAGVSTVSLSPYAQALSAVGDSFNYIDIEGMVDLAKTHGLFEIE